MISSGKENFTGLSVFTCIAFIISTKLFGGARGSTDFRKVKT
jgi:hypothetical protein